MRRFVKSMLLAGVLFGVGFGTVFGLMAGICASVAWGIEAGLATGLAVLVFAGIGGGVPFGVAMAAFPHLRMIQDSVKPAFSDDESILHEGPANHFKGWEGVGGRLYLTTQRLVFKSHALNIQVHELSVPLDRIRTVDVCNTAGLIPNGLQVMSGDGACERFVVERRRKWVEAINGALSGSTKD